MPRLAALWQAEVGGLDVQVQAGELRNLAKPYLKTSNFESYAKNVAQRQDLGSINNNKKKKCILPCHGKDLTFLIKKSKLL